MYMKKCATGDALLIKTRDTENMNPEKLRKVLAQLNSNKIKRFQ